MSPDMGASSLAHTDLVTKLRGIAAYHLAGNDEPAPMLPKEWDGVEAELQALSDTLKANEVVNFESYPTWRYKSILLLPAGVFVWKDEFITAFGRAYSKERMGILNERQGDRTLNLKPLIPHALRDAVVEGFSVNEMPAVQARGDHQNGDFQPLTVSLAGYWDTQFDQLPDAVKPFALKLKLMGWDNLSPMQRQSVATGHDWLNDPRCEPSLYFELMAYQSELAQQESVARGQANHGVALALVDVQKRVDQILAIDRARVGAEIQSLRKRQSEANADVEQLQQLARNPAKGQKSLATSEANSLLKLVVGMAMAGYRYDPAAAKSSVPGEIADDLAKIDGLSLDDDTVRNI